ncbi:MAG: ABC transporter permease subunit [Bauldia sp.]|nr:ABC transporter permease subunit [Bauldia sp.]
MGPLDAFLADLRALATPSVFNVYFAAASIPLGFLFAIAVALARANGRPLVKRLAAGFTYALRGSPLFIQFFMIYSLMLSLNLSLWRPLGIDWFVLHPLFLGPLVLTLNTTAYTAEILYGAMKAVPKGEIEAAKAFGMNPWQRLRSVIWPSVIRTAWPAYTNEVVFLFQATALVYFTLPVINDQRDLMSKAGDLFQRDFNAALHYTVAALYFIAISLVVFWLMGLVYRRLMRHVPGASATRPRFRLQLLR